MILIKLGGSIITDKSSYRTFRPDTVRRLAREMVDSGREFILIHGAGSFGHVVAKKHQLNKGSIDPSQIKGVAQVSWDVRELDTMMLKVLTEEGMDVVSIVPSSAVTLWEGEIGCIDLSKFHGFLELGIVPMSFGDVVLDDVRGFGICSGDQLMMELAREFHPDKVIFVTDVDGVFSSDPHMDPEAKLLNTIDGSTLRTLPRSERCDDVTGSIFAKIEYMMRISDFTDETLILNGNVPGRLGAALKGEEIVCSRVQGGMR
ncbi:MAG TPA: isopentenyl phosphate kinase [Methanomassiliicoccales archaeon]|nr:isopentenyl phosphate kinase [Methanomassiliicoccales archaeon]